MAKISLIGPFKQVATMDGLSIHGAIKDEKFPILTDVGIQIKDDIIDKVEDYNSILAEATRNGYEIINIEGDSVCLPGFIDAHTHICFSGSRAHDYAMRNAGKSYLEIAKAGGGIWDTVRHTRAASQQELIAGILHRAKRLLTKGITTIEVKSGYGLSVKEELKMLLAIKDADQTTQQDLISTCLAAHIFPKDFDGTPADYLTLIVDELFPIISSQQLSKRVDAFIEQEAFTPEVITSYFEAAKNYGFDITVHADQFHPGGSKVAVDMQAISADHLEASTDQEINMLAKSQTIAMALPGASIGLGCAFTPARKILDQGGALAIASDWNPGSAPMGDLLSQASILGAFEKLTNSEVFAGITYRAAAALKLFDRGRITANQKADLVIFPCANLNEILYQQGSMNPSMVFKSGQHMK